MEQLTPVFSVHELNQYIDLTFGNEPNLKKLVVEGELSACKRHPNGHLYFTLKDSEASVPCVMWKSATQGLRFLPRDGLRVRLHGRATLYCKDGRFQLCANVLEKCGEGDLFAEYLRYKAELEAKGWFDPAQKRPIPSLPACVGVVTASSGAALSDIRTIIARRFPSMPIALYPAAVQGEGAAKQIAAAIQKANEERIADVLIVGRGGGSLEDLYAFNEPAVVEAARNSEIPIISAVGHETDISILDFVADLRAPTPSAAAELAVPEWDKLVQQLSRLDARLQTALRNGLSRKRDGLKLKFPDAVTMRLRMHAAQVRQDLENCTDRSNTAVRGCLGDRRAKLEILYSRLEALGPNRWMERGFALITDAAGNPLQRAEQIAIGQEMTMRFADGKVYVTAVGKEME